MSDSSISWRDRARAAAFYLGLLPVYFFLPEQRSTAFSRHHFRQSGALFVVLTGLAAILAIIAVTLSYALIYHRDLYQDYHLERYMMGALRKGFLAWLVFWAFGLGLALLGSTRPMPFIERIGRRTRLVRLAVACMALSYAAIATLVPIALHGRTLAPRGQLHGTVHFLYEDNGMFPRWLFLVAFYPMTRTATTLWGRDSVVVQRFEKDAVTRAVAEGEFLYFGTHGTAKGLMIEGGWLTPEDLADIPTSPRLRFVYLSGCDSGQQREGWLAKFSPAEVVTYDRLSAVLEHAWWLWFRGPEKLRQIHKELSP